MTRSGHLIDLIRWLTGEEIDEVYAELGHMHDFEVEDTGQLCFTLADDTPVFVDTSWSTPEDNDAWEDARLDILGNAGNLSIDCFGQTFKHVARDHGGVRQTYWGTDATEAVISEFVQAIETDQAPSASALDGLRQVEVIDAAYRSAEANEPVAVERHD